MSYTYSANPYAEAAEYGGAFGQTLAQSMYQVPMQRAQMLMQLKQQQQAQQYQQGLMRLKQQGLQNQQDWHNQEAGWHSDQVRIEQQRADDANHWHGVEAENAQNKNQIQAIMAGLAQLREAREGQRLVSLGNGYIWANPQSTQPQDTGPTNQPDPWSAHADSSIPLMAQPQSSLPNLGAQNLQPSPVTGNNLPPGVMRLPDKELNGMETRGQSDAIRMKAMLAYLSVLASTNNLSQQISKQDTNFMPALSNLVYGTSSPVQGTNNVIPVEDWFKNHGIPYSH